MSTSSSSSLLVKGRWSNHPNTLRARVLIEKGEQSPSVLLKTSGASRATIFRLLAEKKGTSSKAIGKTIGRPPSLNSVAKDSLKKIASRTRTLSNAQLAKRLEDKGHPRLHPSTIGRALASLNIRRKLPVSKPRLTERHKQLRLEWCHKNKTRDWRRVIFSDESTLLFRPHRQKVLVIKGRPRPIVPTVKHPPSLMVWGGIGVQGATAIAPVKGHIDSDAYQDIITDYLLPSMNVLYPDGFVLKQDNASVHVSKSTRKFFEENGIEIMESPAMSPDLNPIENLWSIVKKDFALQQKTTSVSEWKEKVGMIWDQIPHELLETLIKSMPRRIAACIAASGGHTKY